MYNIKLIIGLLTLLLAPSGAFASGTLTPAAGAIGGSVTVQESDGSPLVAGVIGIKVTNGSLTDNLDGTVTIATSGATTVTIGSSVVTGGTPSAFLIVGAGPVLQQASITGLVKGNGASAPTAAVAGTDYVAVGGLAGTATALAADPAGCAAGSATTDINASGVSTCANFVEEPGSNGVITRTAADTIAARTLTATANQIDISNPAGTAGNPTFTISSTLTIPGPGIEFSETSGDSACAAGNFWLKANSTVNLFRKCENGVLSNLDTGGAGGLGGTTGATDNAILRADGTGGSTVQSSLATIDDTGKGTFPGGVVAGVASTGVFTMLEGTPPGAGANAGEHNIYFDSSDSGLKSQENGGTVQIYAKTNMNLSSFAATTSAQFFGLISDESGGAGVVLGSSSPLIATPSITGAITFQDGVRQTFNPDATNSGLNIGGQAGDVSSPQNGDIWYDTTNNKFRCRMNGSTVDCINQGAGSGDVTDVNTAAGSGISITTPGGPVVGPITWAPATQTASVTLYDSANATRTLTFGLSGATDPVWTAGDNSMDLTTGVLKQGGVAVITDTSTNTLTNKTLDAEGTGNVISIPKRIWIPAAGCNNATAGSVWDLPTSSPAVAACVTGTNTQKGVLDFADASNLSIQYTHKLPSTWTATGGIDVNVKWFSSATSGDVVWQVTAICVADAETDDPAFNTAVKFTADTVKGTTNQTNDATKNITTSDALSGCAANELMHLKLFRDSGDAGDTMAGTARLIGVELVIREAI